MDANREINEATFSDPVAVEAYHEFHACINNSKAIIEANNQSGLFFDMHGHGHPNNWAELGKIHNRYLDYMIKL